MTKSSPRRLLNIRFVSNNKWIGIRDIFAPFGRRMRDGHFLCIEFFSLKNLPQILIFKKSCGSFSLDTILELFYLNRWNICPQF